MGERPDGGTPDEVRSRDLAQALVDRYWEELLELEPILGTEVGDERFDDRLPDPTEAGPAFVGGDCVYGRGEFQRTHAVG